MISVNNLVKEYKISTTTPGFLGFLTSLVKPNYRTLVASDNLNFQIKSGEVCGIVGLNGAGKSTLIKMLTGVISPSAGSINVNNNIPTKDRIKYVKKIGVVFGQRSQLLWDLPVEPSFRMLKEIYQIPSDMYEKNVRYYSDVFGISEFQSTPVRNLSLGQRMRAEIAAALLHQPDVLFLDEPTIGLDVLVKKQIRSAVAKLNSETGTTVILTSHDLDDIEQLCDRLLILDKGRIVFDGTKDAFIEEHRKNKKITFHLDDNASIADFEESPVMKQLEYSKLSNKTIAVSVSKDGDQVANLMKNIVGELPLRDISIEENSLEDIVSDFYS